MNRPFAALLLLAASCGNNDNVIYGGLGAGATTPDIIFDNIGSSIHGIATLRDLNGNPTGDPMAVIIMSNQPSLCARLQAKRDYFRNPPEPYEALIMFLPTDNPCFPGSGIRVGTFIVGRECDVTSAEIVAVSGPQTVTPLHAQNSSLISLTNFPKSGGNATGSFFLLMDDPYGTGVSHPFQGHFKTSFCPTLDGTLLP